MSIWSTTTSHQETNPMSMLSPPTLALASGRTA